MVRSYRYMADVPVILHNSSRAACMYHGKPKPAAHLMLSENLTNTCTCRMLINKIRICSLLYALIHTYAVTRVTWMVYDATTVYIRVILVRWEQEYYTVYNSIIRHWLCAVVFFFDGCCVSIAFFFSVVYLPWPLGVLFAWPDMWADKRPSLQDVNVCIYTQFAHSFHTNSYFIRRQWTC